MKQLWFAMSLAAASSAPQQNAFGRPCVRRAIAADEHRQSVTELMSRHRRITKQGAESLRYRHAPIVAPLAQLLKPDGPRRGGRTACGNEISYFELA